MPRIPNPYCCRPRSTILLTILISLSAVFSVNSQIAFDGIYSSNIQIPMCCALNLNSNGGATCKTGGSGGNIITNNDYKLQEPKSEENPGLSGIKQKRQVKQIEWIAPYFHMTNNKTTKFLLKNQKADCTAGNILRQFTIDIYANVSFYVQEDGMIQIVVDNIPGTYDVYNEHQYCVNGFGDDFLEVSTCKPPCTDSEPCIQKCCPINEIMSPVGCEQRGIEDHWVPIYYKKPSDAESVTETEASKKKPFYFIRSGMWIINNCFLDGVATNTTSPKTNSYNVLQALGPAWDYFSFKLVENGKIYYRDYSRNWIPFDSNYYCLDGIQNYNEEENVPFNPQELIFVDCPVDDINERHVNRYYGIISIICSLFALITVLVYALLWEKQNVHGWTIMAYTATVFVLFIFLGTAHLLLAKDIEAEDEENYFVRTTGCKILGTICHFLFISMFSWLTMISLDLWLTFRTMTIANARSKGIQRFLMYCGFGWGIPTFMIILSWSLEIRYADDMNSEVKIPMYGADACYVSPEFLWEFVYSVCAILFTANLIFFVLTTWKLVEYKRSTRFATKTAQNQKSYFLFVKLFFIVGILWVFEIIAWASSGTHIPIYWQIMDTMNCLQPVAVFFVFIFKYETINSLAEKYPSIKPCLVPLLLFFDLFEKKKRYQVSKRTTTDDDESTALSMSKTNVTNISKSPETNFEMSSKNYN